MHKRRPILDVHDVKQQKSHVAGHARGFAPRACTEIHVIRHMRSRVGDGARSIQVWRVLAVSLRAWWGPSCLLAEGFWPAAG